MSMTKLTLSAESALISEAKKLAAERNTSVGIVLPSCDDHGTDRTCKAAGNSSYYTQSHRPVSIAFGTRSKRNPGRGVV